MDDTGSTSQVKIEHIDILNISSDKWIAIAALTALSGLCGLIPYAIFHNSRLAIRTDSKKYKLTLATLSSISGGVLLATTVLHILPEVREKAEDVSNLMSLVVEGYPVAEMLMLCGFCLIYFLEELAHFIGRGHHDHHHHHQNDIDNHKSHDHSKTLQPHGHGPECHFLMSEKIDDDVQLGKECPKLQGHSHYDLVMVDSKQQSVSFLRVLISLFALSFHAVMEGIAVGVQDSSDLWITFGAIASHKFIIAFCLGMELMKSDVTLRTFVGSIGLFSIVSPLGVIIGSTLSSEALVENEVLVVIEGFACGTLLYVVFFEILTGKHDHSNKHEGQASSGLVQFLGTFAGILFSAYLISHPHSHSHHHVHGFHGQDSANDSFHHDHGQKESLHHDHGH